jgi:uncharacterized membrane protein YeaQ/YmgE (transglycosylase-associated protein family)
MNIVIWVVVGGLIGWVASLMSPSDRQQGVLVSVMIGILGAALGAWFLSPLFGVSIEQGNFTPATLRVSLLGAVILLAAVTFIRRGRAR